MQVSPTQVFLIVFLAILALTIPCVQPLQIIGDAALGTSIDIEADSETEVSFITGEHLVITADADCSVTLSASVSFDASLPDSIVDANAAYELTSDPQDVAITATLLTKSLGASIIGELGIEFNAFGVVMFDAEQEFWHQLDTAALVDNRINVTLPSTGKFKSVGLKGGASIFTTYGNNRKVAADSSVELEFPKGFSISIDAKEDTDLVVERASEKYESVAELGKSLGAYLNIRASAAAEGAFEAMMSIEYTTEQLAQAGIESAENLRFFVWNSVSGEWEVSGSSYVDTDVQVVHVNTTHFSIWGVAEASGSLDSWIDVSGSSETSIGFNSGEQLVVTANTDTRVRLSLSTSLDLSLPNGLVSGALEYEFQVEDEEAEVVAVLKTRSLSASVLTHLTADIDLFGLAYVDAEFETYHQLDASVFDNNEIRATLPKPGRYAAVGFKADAAVYTTFGLEREVEGDGEEHSYKYPEGFELFLSSETSFNLTISRKESFDTEPEQRYLSGSLFDIHQSTETEVDAELQYSYSSEAVAEAEIEDESMLRFATLVDGNWEVQSGGSVDVEARVVTQSTTHFSEWAVVESSDSSGSSVLNLSQLTFVATLIVTLLTVVV